MPHHGVIDAKRPATTSIATDASTDPSITARSQW
jgi:hypothetical protein